MAPRSSMYGYPARELGLDTEYRSLSFLKKQQKKFTSFLEYHKAELVGEI